MTEYELIDLINSSQDVTIATSMAFVTLSSVYAVAIHLVGKKLPMFFLITMTIGYTLWATLPIRGMYRSVNQMAQLVSELNALKEGLSTPVQVQDIYFNSAILGFFWLLCILYAIYVRRSA